MSVSEVVFQVRLEHAEQPRAGVSPEIGPAVLTNVCGGEEHQCYMHRHLLTLQAAPGAHISACLWRSWELREQS